MVANNNILLTINQRHRQLRWCCLARLILNYNIKSNFRIVIIISLGEKTKTYEMYSEWFSENGCKFSPDIEAATADQILPMVMNDLGIGFVPEEFLEEYNANQTIKQITLQNEIPQRSICLVKRTSQTLNIAAKELQRVILTEITP